MADLSLRGTLTNPSLRDGDTFMLPSTRRELTTPASLAGRLIVLSSLEGLLKFTPLPAGRPAGVLLRGVLTIAPLREGGITETKPLV